MAPWVRATLEHAKWLLEAHWEDKQFILPQAAHERTQDALDRVYLLASQPTASQQLQDLASIWRELGQKCGYQHASKPIPEAPPLLPVPNQQPEASPPEPAVTLAPKLARLIVDELDSFGASKSMIGTFKKKLAADAMEAIQYLQNSFSVDDAHLPLTKLKALTKRLYRAADLELADLDKWRGDTRPTMITAIVNAAKMGLGSM